MKKSLSFVSMLMMFMVYAEDTVVMKNGAKAWSDRDYVISGLPSEWEFSKPVRVQRCTGYSLSSPQGAKQILIGLYSSPASRTIAKGKGLINTGKTFNISSLKYDVYVWKNPPEIFSFKETSAGVVLLAADDDVPAIDAGNGNVAPASKSQKPPTESWRGLEQLQHFSGQEYEFEADPRQVTMYVKEPSKGINSNTGLMLMLHNWGGTYKMTVPWCNALSDRYNVIAISVDYLQSGQSKHDKVPYDHGLLQSMDCLRALYHVQKQLKAKSVSFNPRRVYSAGGSGGGNVSLMVNKLAPSTFSCIVDMCGMPGLTDDIAFGRGNLNAGYSKDPESPKYLTPARQEICNPGYLPHLEQQQKLNPDNKVIIVHGQDDNTCSVIDKITIFQNMIKAKFRPEGNFITKVDLDGVILNSSGHSLGDRQAIIIKYADSYLKENGSLAASVKNPTNFEMANKVELPVSGGNYTVDFSSEAPTLIWLKK
jgi:predicted esterase